MPFSTQFDHNITPYYYVEMNDGEWIDLERQIGDPTELEMHLRRIDETRDMVQVAILDHAKTPDEQNTLIARHSDHANALKDLLEHLFSDESGYETDEAATVAATMLVNDDLERVDFLREVTGNIETDNFRYGYGERDNVITAFKQLAHHMKDEHEHEHDFPDEYIMTILFEHITNMEADINNFLNSSLVKTQTEKAARSTQQKQNRKERLIHFASTAAAVAVGSLVAKALWRDKKS